MEEFDIYNLASGYAVSVVETTSDRSGYPRNLKNALIDFSTYDEAEFIASKYGGTVVELKKREGDTLWFRNGNAYSDLDVESIIEGSCGDNCELLSCSPEEFIQEYVNGRVLQCKDIDDVNQYFENVKEIASELKTLGEDEFVLVNNLGPKGYSLLNVYPKHACHVNDADVTSYAIGVVFE